MARRMAHNAAPKTSTLNTKGQESSNDKKKKDMSKVKCFTCYKTSHYASQCPSKKKGKGKTQAKVSIEDDEEFATGFANEFSLASYLLGSRVRGAWLEDIDAWVVDSGGSIHMTGMRSMFLGVSKIDSDCYVRCGASAMQTTKGVGTMLFQLKLGAL